MKDNNRLIIYIVGVMGIAALAGLIGLAFIENPTVADLGQIAFGVLTFFGGMGVEKQRQRATDQTTTVDAPAESVVTTTVEPVESSKKK